MLLKKGDTDYFFAVPLQEIKLDQFSINIPPYYCFCKINYPKDLQDLDDFLYFIKVYDFFNLEVLDNINEISKKPLLFGESRFIPFIPIRGEMSWKLISELENKRSLDDFDDLKECSLNTNLPPENRNWWRLIKSGLSIENYREKVSYSEIENLEWADEINEIGVKFRIYIHLIKNSIREKNLILSIEDWKNIMYEILSNEPSIKNVKSKSEDFKSTFIENFLYDYADFWSIS